MSSTPQTIAQTPNVLLAQDTKASKTAIRFIVDKTDDSPSPKTYQYAQDQLEVSMGVYPLIFKTGHGLTESDEGKPLNGMAVWDNRVSGSQCTGVLCDVVDANNFRVCQPFGSLWIPAALLETGYNIATSSRTAWWDRSQSKYVTAAPINAPTLNGPTIYVCGYNATLNAFYCLVLGANPLADLRRFPAPTVDRGAYSAGTAYVPNDKVTHSSASWVNIKAGTGQTPALGSRYWALQPQSGDVGKPLFRSVLYDDTNSAHEYTHILTAIRATGANGLYEVASTGAEIVLPLSLLEGGSTFDPWVSGSFLWWDLSFAQYRGDKQADADPTARELLFFISHNSADSTFLARVL